jgi:hypothetical protein
MSAIGLRDGEGGGVRSSVYRLWESWDYNEHLREVNRNSICAFRFILRHGGGISRTLVYIWGQAPKSLVLAALEVGNTNRGTNNPKYNLQRILHLQTRVIDINMIVVIHKPSHPLQAIILHHRLPIILQ